MDTRRRFLMTGAAGLAGGLAARAAKTTLRESIYDDLEARIARKSFQGITKDMLPTPCMVVDIDMFEGNVKTMAAQAKSTGLNVRPHVKIHKSVDVAKRQIREGAIGVTCATIAEAELMSNAGIKGVLWTKQPASANYIARAIHLTKRDPSFMFVVDDPQVLSWVADAAATRQTKVRLAVSVFAGMKRQGIENGQPALELAQHVERSNHATFEGFMAYSGGAAHTHGWEKRRQKSADDLAGVRETVALAKKAGLPVNFVSGGSTGTYNIDHENGLTELEAGSYVFMDTAYFGIGGKTDPDQYSDFAGSLTVLTTVDDKRWPTLATTDYGNKALAKNTDKVKGMPWLEVGNQGAEYGALKWKEGDKEVKIGDRVEIYCTTLDMSTNCYDRYFVAKGDQIVDVWPIMGRSGAAQR